MTPTNCSTASVALIVVVGDTVDVVVELTVVEVVDVDGVVDEVDVDDVDVGRMVVVVVLTNGIVAAVARVVVVD